MASTPLPPEKLIERRLDEVGPMFRAAWDNYIKFYTVFLMFSLGAMGWVMQKDVRHIKVVAVAFIGQTLLCTITSFGMAAYSKRVAKDHVVLERALSEPNPPPKTQFIPVLLAVWAGVANGIGMLGMIALWIWVGFRP